MTTPHPVQGSRKDWLIDRSLRGLLGSVMALPYEARVKTMGAIMRKAVGPLAGYQARAIANLRMIYPNWPDDKITQTARAVCDNFGRTLIENYSWRELSKRLATTSAQGAGLAALADAHAAGKPVIFVTGHFGNHEAPRHVLTQMGYEIGGLYRPMSNPYFNAHYAQTMEQWGGPVFAQGKQGTIGFARHLKRGGKATLLFDVATSAGIKQPFLGHNALTATSAADLALRTDAVVIPYFGIRQPDGLTFKIDVEAPIVHDTPEAMMIAMTKRLELQITARPEQWFWVHNRWKNT